MGAESIWLVHPISAVPAHGGVGIERVAPLIDGVFRDEISIDAA